MDASSVTHRATFHATAGVPDTPSQSPGRRVLILADVEQAARISKFFTQFAHGHAYAVDAASTGPEAAAVLGRGRPDLIVLDPHVKGVDALALLKQLRAADRSIRVIVVSDRHDGRMACEVLAAGIFAYVPKPCEFLPFEHLVGLALRSRPGGAAPAPS